MNGMLFVLAALVSINLPLQAVAIAELPGAGRAIVCAGGAVSVSCPGQILTMRAQDGTVLSVQENQGLLRFVRLDDQVWSYNSITKELIRPPAGLAKTRPQTDLQGQSADSKSLAGEVAQQVLRKRIDVRDSLIAALSHKGLTISFGGHSRTVLLNDPEKADAVAITKVGDIFVSYSDGRYELRSRTSGKLVQSGRLKLGPSGALVSLTGTYQHWIIYNNDFEVLFFDARSGEVHWWEPDSGIFCLDASEDGVFVSTKSHEIYRLTLEPAIKD